MPQTALVRTVGVEEELLLVDPTTGEPLAVSAAVLRAVEPPDPPDEPPEGSPGGTVEAELQQQQIETDTHPQRDVEQLLAEVVAARRLVAEAARAVGATVAALGTSPLPVTPRTTPNARYLAMRERFGLTEAEQLTCGLHVHVSVASDDEGVGVLDRIRGWLPVLTALSASSPFWQGTDTGYASYRSQAWSRWPMAGPLDVLGSAAAYRARVAQLLATDVPMDPAMLYFDARLSTRYPTVELRVADVCLDARDTALVAALGRALVETAAPGVVGRRACPAAAHRARPSGALAGGALGPRRRPAGPDHRDPAAGRRRRPGPARPPRRRPARDG